MISLPHLRDEKGNMLSKDCIRGYWFNEWYVQAEMYVLCSFYWEQMFDNSFQCDQFPFRNVSSMLKLIILWKRKIARVPHI